MKNSKQLAKEWKCEESEVLQALFRVAYPQTSYLAGTVSFPLKIEISENEIKENLLKEGKIKDTKKFKIIKDH